MRLAIPPVWWHIGKGIHRKSLNIRFMNASKTKSKRSIAIKSAKSPFQEKADKAMRRAQHTAARENARFGLRLIAQAVS